MSDAERLDAEDPLASFRELFAIEDEGTIYLDGNSLGRPPAATRERMTELVDRWGSDLVRGWDDWIELPERVGDLLATGVLGARPGEAIVCDSTTINLYKLASALIADRPGAILADAGDFPTNRYVLAGLARAQGRRLVLARDGIPAALGDDDLAPRQPLARRLPHRRPRGHGGDRGARAPRPCSGISATRRASWSRRGSHTRSAAPTST